MMKKSPAIFAAALGISLAALPASAEAQVTVDLEAAVVSNYAWRGFSLADAFVLQPSLTLGFGETGIALNVWGSAALSDREIYDGSDELDFTLSYDVALGSGGLSLGYIQYTFPNGGEGAKHSEEAYASFTLDNFLAPSLLASYDFGLMDGFYAAAGVGPEFALSETAVLGLGASVGVSNYAFDEDGSNVFGFNDFQVGASLGLGLGSIAVTPFAGVSIAAEDINPDNEFWAGVTIGFSW